MGSTRRRSHFTSCERTEEMREVVFGRMIQRITLLIVRGLMPLFLRAERKVVMSVLRDRRRRAIGAISNVISKLQYMFKRFK